MTETHIEALEGVAEPWRVRLLNYPVLACEAGHVRRELYPAFNTEWSDALAHRSPDLWLKPKGWLRREFVCAHCQSPVQPISTARLQQQVTLRQQRERAFEVEITGPALACGSCSHAWIADGDAAEVFEALANALRAAEISRH